MDSGADGGGQDDAGSDAFLEPDAAPIDAADAADAAVDPCVGRTAQMLGTNFVTSMAVFGSMLVVTERESESVGTPVTIRAIDLATLEATELATSSTLFADLTLSADFVFRASDGTLERYALSDGALTTLVDTGVNSVSSSDTHLYYGVNEGGFGAIFSYRLIDGMTTTLVEERLGLGDVTVAGDLVLFTTLGGSVESVPIGGGPTARLGGGLDTFGRIVAFGSNAAYPSPADGMDQIFVIESGADAQLLTTQDTVIALAVGPDRVFWWGGSTRQISSLAIDGSEATPRVEVDEIVNVGALAATECELVYSGLQLATGEPVLGTLPLD